MTRPRPHAPAGEVGSLDCADVAAAIDSAIAAVDFAVEPVTVDLADVGAAVVPVEGEAAGHENTVAIDGDPVCVLPHAAEVGPRNAPVCGGDREGSS